MYAFNYCRPQALAEALEIKQSDADARRLAGGMTLLPTLKLRLAAPSQLIDLADIAELKAVDAPTDAIELGSMTPHAVVAHSPVVRARIPALAALAGGIGDPQVRNRGTLGGSIANNDPAADYPAALLGLGATIKTSQRELSADEFFTGMFETALREEELVLSVRLPIPERAAYIKFRTPGSRYAIVGVMVAKTPSGVRVAITGAGPGVYRERAMEAALSQRFRPEALEKIAVSATTMNADLHASPAYRAHLVKVLAARAVAAARGSEPDA
jgi:carbon-monoxide dehydrogenase medium subunit